MYNLSIRIISGPSVSSQNSKRDIICSPIETRASMDNSSQADDSWCDYQSSICVNIMVVPDYDIRSNSCTTWSRFSGYCTGLLLTIQTTNGAMSIPLTTGTSPLDHSFVY